MDRVVSYYVGLFLKVFTALLLLPVAVGKLYGESFVLLEGFIIAAFFAIVLGYLLGMYGEKRKPDAIEAMIAATIGWLLAVALGGIPFMTQLGWSFSSAFFEAMSGFSTTGMSLITDIEALPHSMIFWRAFSQWIGGLGILTFFVTVVIEAGGAATALISAETNKTSSGSIRPSLFNAIKALWYVYIVFTLLEVVLLHLLGMDVFNATMYSLTTMPTGGFSHTVGGLAAFDSWAINGVIAFFMLAGGTNFLLLYSILNGKLMAPFRDYEFRLYMKLMAAAAIILGADLVLHQGATVVDAARTAVFMAVSVTSSTGFELKAINSFPELSQMLFLILMFVGGSLGSTTGGFKMLRLGVMFKLVAREIRGFSLPRNALNQVLVNGKKLKESELYRIVALFFLWVSIIVFGAIVTVAMTPMDMMDAFQGLVSTLGSMGPLFISIEELVALPGPVKILWAFAMLAGRLELLPVLVLLNVEIVKRLRG